MSVPNPNPSPEPSLSVIEDVQPGPSSLQQPQDGAEQHEEEVFVSFVVKYSNSFYSVRLSLSDSVADLKAVLWSLTDVPPPGQKLIGLSKGKIPQDDAKISELEFPPASTKPRPPKPGQSFTLHPAEVNVHVMLVGTPENDRFRDPQGTAKFAEDLEETAPDIDYKQAVKEAVPPSENPKYLLKLQKVIDRFSDFAIINPPRPGKNLLVLDLDYTIADTKRLLDVGSLASEAARPGLYEFLASVWPHYDICIWSQTSWRWLEAKLTELNMLADPRFNISFVLDRTPMFSITSKGRKHEVKPLELIWRRFPDIYGPKNTLHVDDLSRNFAMNPGNGLKIKAYKHSPCFDTELVALQRYCMQLAHASVSDFSKLDHSLWKHHTGPELEGDEGNENRDADPGASLGESGSSTGQSGSNT
ncbi:HAD-superfamily subfamily IIID h [Violaceomyces palustris]|uniref:HAD-superfamily subfamily IIID h n=1 Tax=Violaceomyces palustris TaxID=1673888 RepID=A0ACD0P3F6_9BASI|nr:HAD-superfamily subfamily IIID h [Violaceomyces palustris]